MAPGSLARRWRSLAREIKGHTAHLKALTASAAAPLLEAYGVGFDSAAELLVAVGDNRARIQSEAAFTKLCGVCPIPAGSSKTSGRHRLNRGGNRQANAALHRIFIVRMRWHAATITYAQRRTAEGLGKKDIIRCLKRFVYAKPITSSLQPTRGHHGKSLLDVYRRFNAIAESLFTSIKGEWIDLHWHPSRATGHRAVAEYIDSFYNPLRRHSLIGYLSPDEFELRAHMATLTA